VNAEPAIAEPLQELPRLGKPRAFTVAKRPRETNEDAWQYSRKGVGVVSDGASISFDSATWSRLLVRRYAQHPRIDDEWVAGAIVDYAKLHDRDALPWAQQAAFDRGSFASLLAVRDAGFGRVEVFAIGDSLAVLCDGDRLVESFPYQTPDQFDASPQLLSTNPAENAFLRQAETLAGLSSEWDLGELEAPMLLCVTDALGRWLLAEQGREPSPIALLRQIRTRRQFTRLIEREREAGRMRRDDTTLLAYCDWSA
jgi:hypothetical protein